MKKLYLVDVSSMFFRAFFAVPYMKAKKTGLPTNALYGFLSMSLKLLRDVKPDYMVFCQDRKEPSFRLDLYDQYKANRDEMPEDLVPQMPYIEKLTDVMGIPRVSKKGYEADDVIGSLAEFGKKNGLQVVIVSGDKDFAQLIDDKVTMYDTMKNNKYDVDGVLEKWGVHPEQFIDYLALIGDSSDNIPGVRGIGPKSAQKLLAEYKTLEGIYENVENISGKAMKAKIAENEDMAYLSKELVTIVTDLDLGFKLDDLKLKPVDREKLHETLTELEFKSFEKKFFADNNGMNNGAAKEQVKKETKKTVKVNVTKQAADVGDKVSEWSVEDFHKKVEPYSDLYVLETERGRFFQYKKKLVQCNGDNKQLGKVLGDKFIRWKGFDVKSTWRELDVKNPICKWDQMLAAYVVKPKNVDSFEKTYEEHCDDKIPDLATEKQILSCHQQLEQVLMEKLEEQNGLSVLEDIELPLAPVLHEMEQNGICVDTVELQKQSKSLAKEIEKLDAWIQKEAGESFNVASTKQLGQILFEKMGLPPSKKTKTGYSTASDVLSKLSDEYPICGKVLEFREYSKLKSTYVDSLPKLLNPETGKVHTTLKQAVAATGRLSSVNPNLQNIPIRTERGKLVRKAFISSPGCQLLALDYSQIELRVLAHITGDTGLINAFENGLDVHAATASEVFSVDLDDVTSDQRRIAKAVNFGIAYGQGAFGLAETLGITRKEGKEIIEAYFKKFKKVQDYIVSTKELAKKQGYVEMLSGRRRYIDELSSKNAMLRSFGERAAINAPMQGSASDIVKKAMIQISESVATPMILQVHDELIFDCKTEDVDYEAAEIKRLMESAEDLCVPLIANIGVSENWLDAH